jgi:hypothetical protein
LDGYPELPFGGPEESGQGGEVGRFATEEFTDSKRSNCTLGRGLSGGQKSTKSDHELRSEKRVYSESPDGARLPRKPIAPSDYSTPGFVSVVYGEGPMEARLRSLDELVRRLSVGPTFTFSELQRMGSLLTIKLCGWRTEQMAT